MSEQLTATEALQIVSDLAQRMRERGDPDMRTIIHACSGIAKMIQEGKPREEIIADWGPDPEDEE